MAIVTIFDGSLDDQGELGGFTDGLVARMNDNGHEVAVLRLRDLHISRCTGCWSCWVKTPGDCAHKDDGDEFRSAWLRSDLVILACRLEAGFISSVLKTAVDKFIPLAHPYIKLVNGECAHLHRYGDLAPLGVILEPGPRDSEEDVRVTADWAERFADQCRVDFVVSATTADPLESTAATIEQYLAAPKVEERRSPTRPAPVPIPEVDPVAGSHRLLVLSGSARAESNTAILMEHFCDGFGGIEGNETSFMLLKSPRQRAEAIAAWNEADLVVFALPLYVHAMAGHLKRFFELLEDTEPRPGRRVAFMVQSGFPEAHQSRWLEQYLARLPARWGAIYLGTAVRGGVEGIQIQPPWMTKKLYAQLAGLGLELGRSGRLDRDLVTALARGESLSVVARFMFTLASRVGLTDFYWNKRLKENGAFGDRFARPLEP